MNTTEKMVILPISLREHSTQYCTGFHEFVYINPNSGNFYVGTASFIPEGQYKFQDGPEINFSKNTPHEAPLHLSLLDLRLLRMEEFVWLIDILKKHDSFTGFTNSAIAGNEEDVVAWSYINLLANSSDTKQLCKIFELIKTIDQEKIQESRKKHYWD